MLSSFSSEQQQILVAWAFVFTVFVVATVLAHLAISRPRK